MSKKNINIKKSYIQLLKEWKKDYKADFMKNIEKTIWFPILNDKYIKKEISKNEVSKILTEILFIQIETISNYMAKYTYAMSNVPDNLNRIKTFFSCQRTTFYKNKIPKYNFIFSGGLLKYPLLISINVLRNIDFFEIWEDFEFNHITVFRSNKKKWTDEEIKLFIKDFKYDFAYDGAKATLRILKKHSSQSDLNLFNLRVKID